MDLLFNSVLCYAFVCCVGALVWCVRHLGGIFSELVVSYFSEMVPTAALTTSISWTYSDSAIL